MYSKYAVVILCLCAAYANCQFFSFKNLRTYARVFQFNGLSPNETGNELWAGLFRDCDESVTFACIQKNAYTYLDTVFVERDNITVFDGVTMTKNHLDYGTCRKKADPVDENLVEGSGKEDCDQDPSDEEEVEKEGGREFEEEQSPLEEVTNAFRKRAVKFLATRDYEIQLPDFYFEGATIKISPREVDENGALVRLDFGERAVQSEGRIFFKKIRKFIQNKLLTSLLALLLIIKLIKIKFMFIIPFLFGVGTAKKLFLKLLLFFIPAFAHIFKLCSSYYSSHHTKYHHHHHQIAHHHHHVPVPVPVPAYYDHHHHHPHHHDEEFDGYDYAHPHIQYRKDIEELKEWGIEPYEEPYDEQPEPAVPGRVPGVLPAPYPAPTYAGAYDIPQYAANAQSIAAPYTDKRPVSAHSLAYSAYVDNNRRTSSPPVVNVPLGPASLPSTVLPTNAKNSYPAFAKPNIRQASAKSNQVEIKGTVTVQKPGYDDEFYGPIINRLEEIFRQLRFVDEPCRERLVCSMYKNPTVYTPHSNLVSNELSRDPQELKRTGIETSSSQKFHRYLNAARLGQDGGDCLRTYPCHINTE